MMMIKVICKKSRQAGLLRKEMERWWERRRPKILKRRERRGFRSSKGKEQTNEHPHRDHKVHAFGSKTSFTSLLFALSRPRIEKKERWNVCIKVVVLLLLQSIVEDDRPPAEEKLFFSCSVCVAQNIQFPKKFFIFEKYQRRNEEENGCIGIPCWVITTATAAKFFLLLLSSHDRLSCPLFLGKVLHRSRMKKVVYEKT